MKNNPVQITRNRRTAIEPAEIADSVELSDMETRLLDKLADILDYPAEDWDPRIESARESCIAADGEAAGRFLDFCSETKGLSLTELQELYTRTFDLSPLCALEVGYHLFGEDYKRGEFLAQLRESETGLDIGQERQLPDYLPVMLRLLSRTDDPELRSGLIGYCLIPGLKKMNACFKGKPNPYRHVIGFIEETLREKARRSIIGTEAVENTRCQYV